MKDIFHHCNSLIELRVESITELHNKGILPKDLWDLLKRYNILIENKKG